MALCFNIAVEITTAIFQKNAVTAAIFEVNNYFLAYSDRF